MTVVERHRHCSLGLPLLTKDFDIAYRLDHTLPEQPVSMSTGPLRNSSPL